jgi:2OG-Fe(II) oxygenase superfamily
VRVPERSGAGVSESSSVTCDNLGLSGRKGDGVISDIPALEKSATLFSYSQWSSKLALLASQYLQNHPIPHVLLTDFLPPEVTAAAAREFPAVDTATWTHWQHHNEDKHGMTKLALFPPLLRAVTEELNSPNFLTWLSVLTGIPDLLADGHLDGGGLHQASRGGFLNLHTDFSHHHYHKNWRRRLNLILYLNEGWRPEWGGAIELWDSRMRNCVVKYPPLINQVLIFNTDERSFHGFPEPLGCPEGVFRKSLALYYYNIDPSEGSRIRSTNYRARPGDGIRKSTLIWLDKQAVHLYSKAKARIGFSDDFASRMLGRFSKKRNPSGS